MRLIEKECPNCGAGLHFTKDDTSCKCEYCKREFEIERDTDKKKLVDQFILSELKTPFKFFSFFAVGNFATQAIVTGVTFIIIVIVAFNIISGLSDSNSIFNRNASLISNVSELSNSDYSTLDLDSNIIISKETTATAGGYTNLGKIKRIKMYVVSNKKTNYLIPVYKVVYKYFSSDETHTVYIPIKYKNVKKKSNSIAFYLDNGEISAPEYHFNDNNYSYGYADLDTLYNEVIKEFEKDYTITEKKTN